MNLSQIIQQFHTKGTLKSFAAFGNGHINDTFRVVTDHSSGTEYLLQRINHLVFSPVDRLMANIYKVSSHLKTKNPNDPLASLTLIPTKNRACFYQDDQGQYWRMYLLLNELITYEVAENTQQIFAGGQAFGRFLAQLQDFPVGELYPIIPDFHNVLMRLERFQQALEQADPLRKAAASTYSTYLLQQAPLMSQIHHLGGKGEIPLRVTHNDTKFNNVMLDHQGNGRCVIDLDTVMPGYVHYDFGDGVRTSITTVPEDEPDLNKIQIDSARFRAFAEGYLSQTASLLNPIEIQYLGLSGALMAYIMGVRFLTDYLMGDVYYKIHFPEHNLQRAISQLTLTQKIIEQRPALDQIINSVVSL